MIQQFLNQEDEANMRYMAGAAGGGVREEDEEED